MTVQAPWSDEEVERRAIEFLGPRDHHPGIPAEVYYKVLADTIAHTKRVQKAFARVAPRDGMPLERES